MQAYICVLVKLFVYIHVSGFITSPEIQKVNGIKNQKIMITITERKNKMFEKKQHDFKTPDLTKMQEVIIDVKTRIYIPVGADPKEAKSRYHSRLESKKL